MQPPDEAASALKVTLLQRPPLADSASRPDGLVHCPSTSWTALRALSWTAKENGSPEAAVITFMGHSHYPDRVLGSSDLVAPLSQTIYS